MRRYAGGLTLSRCLLEGKFKHPRSLSRSHRILSLKASGRSSSLPSRVRGGSRPPSLTWSAGTSGVGGATAPLDGALGLWALPGSPTAPPAGALPTGIVAPLPLQSPGDVCGAVRDTGVLPGAASPGAGGWPARSMRRPAQVTSTGLFRGQGHTGSTHRGTSFAQSRTRGIPALWFPH